MHEAEISPPEAAEDPAPQGIGFAQAEEGVWFCRHEDPQEALSCAREHCSEQAPGQECWPTAWCFPANWSGTMTVWLEDFYTTQVLCGAPSEKALTGALAAVCAGDEAAFRCDVDHLIDPEGNELPIQAMTFPGPAQPPSGEDAAAKAEDEPVAADHPAATLPPAPAARDGDDGGSALEPSPAEVFQVETPPVQEELSQ